jgi:hypothetical protein
MERVAREANPGISDEMVRQVVDEMEKDRASDPLLLNDTIDRMSAQMIAANIGRI